LSRNDREFLLEVIKKIIGKVVLLVARTLVRPVPRPSDLDFGHFSYNYSGLKTTKQDGLKAVLPIGKTIFYLSANR